MIATSSFKRGSRRLVNNRALRSHQRPIEEADSNEAKMLGSAKLGGLFRWRVLVQQCGKGFTAGEMAMHG